VERIAETIRALERVADSLNESVREREATETLIQLQKALGKKVCIFIFLGCFPIFSV
jgi:hypothetical protein